LIVCVVTAGIEATREHTDKGTAIALLRIPRNDVSNVTEDEYREDKPKTADINAGLMSDSIVRDSANVRADVSPNLAYQADFDIIDNTDIRNVGSVELVDKSEEHRGDCLCEECLPV
jgi:hypothetical protein